MAILYGEDDEEDVSEDDGDRVGLASDDRYLAHQYRIVNNNTNDCIKIKINLQSTIAPSDSAIYLQVWNDTSSLWETLTYNNTEDANTDFDLEHTIESSLSNYYDNDFEIALRTYQENV